MEKHKGSPNGVAVAEVKPIRTLSFAEQIAVKVLADRQTELDAQKQKLIGSIGLDTAKNYRITAEGEVFEA